jgi:hypothetical protein
MGDVAISGRLAGTILNNGIETLQRAVVSSAGGLHTYATNGVAFVDETNGVAVVEQGQFDYETVAASQTDQVLGVTGGTGDFLHTLIIVVATAATSQVQIKDGAGAAITVFPNSPGGGVGTYTIELNVVSTGGSWKVTTGAGVSVIAVGRFTA